MSNILKTGFLLGLGAAVQGKERMDQYLDEMLVKGKITPKEFDELYHDLIKKGESKEEEWNYQSKERLNQLMTDLNLFTKEEYNALEARVNDLEERLNRMENKTTDHE
ncbi:phasin family protein [Salisediminibacterium beveridgei]|uniref:Polyhydroxyalkanoate synthesis regulator phasin n=1 Tax=Salisediminibacterium beveridgei TaxID=632773 RepID=A0A1D7QTT5_9BACI|nr:hypothetical protein [Salisediminibacterium beveridgei]AOM82432.1 hypothetical protein BBEV_1063 [Salisediminibacterium beveridgei]